MNKYGGHRHNDTVMMVWQRLKGFSARGGAVLADKVGSLSGSSMRQGFGHGSSLIAGKEHNIRSIEGSF
ncbi:hypothetical protein M6B38_175000 [Iris pallida]|uniref:Uncharacterized protein n=1 Tax=Iris pallida TaxID=29817 RepID=A0AAX6ERE9_IRIPA|nr:hypothetical protein M6B38_175000 [Iris pallida]